jgi:hypothetical protein
MESIAYDVKDARIRGFHTVWCDVRRGVLRRASGRVPLTLPINANTWLCSPIPLPRPTLMPSTSLLDDLVRLEEQSRRNSQT